MNQKNIVVSDSKIMHSLFAALLVCGALTVSSHAQTPVNSLTITSPNGTSYASVDSRSSMGMYEWVVSGSDQLVKQWFYYRNGDGLQRSIDSGAISYSAAKLSDNSMYASYNYGDFSIRVDYELTSIGTGKADINESVTIHNNTSETITNFNFYQYSDFNLGGIPDGDTITIDTYSALQTKGVIGTPGAIGIAEGIIDPEANAFEANTTGGAGSTLTKLESEPNLNLSGNEFASGDVTWAFQWNLQIAVGTDTVLLKDKLLSVKPIPEPSTFAFLAIGFALLGLAKRR